MWKPKVTVKHEHEIKVPSKEDLEPVVELLKNVGLTLVIGIPSVILFAVCANTAADLLTEKLTE